MTAVVALAAAGAFAAPASSATPSNKQLSRQIKVMQKQVKILQGQVKKLRKDVGDVQAAVGATLIFAGCNVASTADAFQGTWETIDQINAAMGRPDQYPAPAPVVDPLNSCQLLEIQRQSNTVPPTINVFQALLNLFR